MTPEAYAISEPLPPTILQAHLLSQDQHKTNHVYEIFAGESSFGMLKLKQHWKILEWEGGDIFQDPQAELLDNLRESLGVKRGSELISCGIVFQDRKKTPQFTAVIAPKKSRQKIKEYEAIMTTPSKIVEIRYDTAVFQVVARNPDHNGGNNTVRLKTRINTSYSREVIQWTIDLHAKKDELPAIDTASSAHTLSLLS